MGSILSKDQKNYKNDDKVIEKVKPVFARTKGYSIVTIHGREFNEGLPNDYILPRDADEVERLHAQYFAIKTLWNGQYIFSEPKAMLETGEKLNVIDIGCGPGTWCVEVATNYSNANVIGFDISDIFPTNLNSPNVSFQVANAVEKFPFEDNSIHIASIRTLAVAIKINDWTKILNEVYRVLVPGGYLNMVEPNLYFTGNDIVKKFNKQWTT